MPGYKLLWCYSHEASNERPISIYHYPKLLRKLPTANVSQYKQLLLTSTAVWFRPNQSTETATFHVIEQKKSELDKVGVGAVFLD